MIVHSLPVVAITAASVSLHHIEKFLFGVFARYGFGLAIELLPFAVSRLGSAQGHSRFNFCLALACRNMEPKAWCNKIWLLYIVSLIC